MKVRAAFVLALGVLLMLAGDSAVAQVRPGDARELRERVETRFDVVPLSDGLALRPKTRMRDVRLIEVSDSGIAINGTSVTGRELREQLGSDAEMVLRLSYLDAAERRALFPERAATDDPAIESPRDVPAVPDTEPDSRRHRRSRGDRVRVFGGVAVERDERIEGQAVAVLGSARIDGEVGDQVVAVLGSVELGPNAVVGGDVVSVGGRVRRAPTAQVRGSVTEVALGGPDVHVGPWFTGWSPASPFSGAPRLIMTTFRLVLLILLASIAFVVARATVERSAQRVTDEPLKSTVIGVVAQLLLIPVLLLTVIVLALSVIGIPLLLLLPFAVLFQVLMALAGFTGSAWAIGQWVRRRFGFGVESAWLQMVIGIMLILLPLLLGRVIGLGGWAAGPFAFFLIAIGFAVEYLAWASGFGAVLANTFSRWQARRASRMTPPATTTTPATQAE